MKSIAALLILGLSLNLPTGSAIAQVIPDGSIPTNVNSLDNLNFTIDGGGRSGNNLFHSFSQFSVPTNGSAAFNNAVDVQNIFARVTGRDVSRIDGVLRANGSANLFLLNPNGLLFGPNAQLNIGGSFLGTTASSIQFADQTEFSATNLAPLLTMSAPIGLQIGQQPGAIQVTGAGHQLIDRTGFSPYQQAGTTPHGLRVQPNQQLALIGGDITLMGGVLTAPQGQITLVATDSAQIAMDPIAGTFAQLPTDHRGRTIQLAQQALVDVSGQGVGGIAIQSRNLSLQDSSVILSQSQSLTPNVPSGRRINLNIQDQLTLDGSNTTNGISSSITTAGLAAASSADIEIQTADLALLNTASILSRNFSQTSGGNIKINASRKTLIAGDSPTSEDVSIITASTFTQGTAGNIQLTTNQLALLNGGSISSNTFNSGASGNLMIGAQDILISGVESQTFRPSNIAAATLAGGKGGNIEIVTERLRLQAGGWIDSSSYASGAAGNVDIQASDFVEVAGGVPSIGLNSLIASAAAPLQPPSLRAIFQLPDQPEGSSGSVMIRAAAIRVLDGATIDVRTEGTGKAGEIILKGDRLLLSNDAKIRSNSASGQGGNLDLTFQSEVLLRGGSQIIANAGGTGNGGDILINTPILLGLENSDIIANAIQGRGGNIQITTQGIFGLKNRPQLTPESDITASSKFGVNGTVEVNKLGVDPNSALLTLPVGIVDPSQRIAQTCNASQGSSFVATGRGGIPSTPLRPVNNNGIWHDLRTTSPKTTASMTIVDQSSIPTITSSTTPLQEATGWFKTQQGQIILNAQTVAPLPNKTANCSRGSS
jgi:filamentous hemagglutinin family protein